MPSLINATTTNGLVTSADNSGSLQLQTNNGTTAVTIDTSQNVGIGTTSPTSRLGVSGAAQFIGVSPSVFPTTGSGIEVVAGVSGQENYIQTYNRSGSSWQNLQINSAQTVFGTSGTERMRITSGGNLFVGTSSALGQSAKSVIVNNSASDVGLIVQSSASGDVGIDGVRIGKFDNNTSTSQIFVRFTINNQGNGSGSITANGANACAFGSFSDERLKENIVDLPSQLENICNLRPVEFDYKDGSGHQIGFVAQEMQTVYPDVVAAGDDEMLMIGGWSKTEARLVKAIQELKAELDATKAEVQALKGVA